MNFFIETGFLHVLWYGESENEKFAIQSADDFYFFPSEQISFCKRFLIRFADTLILRH